MTGAEVSCTTWGTPITFFFQRQNFWKNQYFETKNLHTNRFIICRWKSRIDAIEPYILIYLYFSLLKKLRYFLHKILAISDEDLSRMD